MLDSRFNHPQRIVVLLKFRSFRLVGHDSQLAAFVAFGTAISVQNLWPCPLEGHPPAASSRLDTLSCEGCTSSPSGWRGSSAGCHVHPCRVPLLLSINGLSCAASSAATSCTGCCECSRHSVYFDEEEKSISRATGGCTTRPSIALVTLRCPMCSWSCFSLPASLRP